MERPRKRGAGGASEAVRVGTSSEGTPLSSFITGGKAVSSRLTLMELIGRSPMLIPLPDPSMNLSGWPGELGSAPIWVIGAAVGVKEFRSGGSSEGIGGSERSLSIPDRPGTSDSHDAASV